MSERAQALEAAIEKARRALDGFSAEIHDGRVPVVGAVREHLVLNLGLVSALLREAVQAPPVGPQLEWLRVDGREQELRAGARELASLWRNADNWTWHTWDEHGIGGENGVDRDEVTAKQEVIAALQRRGWLPASLSEPTPELYIVADVTASATGWTPASHPSVEPAPPPPAPCVWRENEGLAHPPVSCSGVLGMEARAMRLWRGCPYCLKPLQITR